MDLSNILQGEHVRLTALNHEDYAILASWYQDAGFLRLLDAYTAKPKNERELRDWLEGSQKSNDRIPFAIRSLADGELLGYIELDNIVWNQGAASLSVAIGKRDNWGKGYGREALQLAVRFVFDELNLHRIGLTVFSYNERAIALYESLGFRREGTLREFLHRDGQRYDMFWYGLLRREWEESRRPK